MVGMQSTGCDMVCALVFGGHLGWDGVPNTTCVSRREGFFCFQFTGGYAGEAYSRYRLVGEQNKTKLKKIKNHHRKANNELRENRCAGERWRLGEVSKNSNQNCGADLVVGMTLVCRLTHNCEEL